MADRTVAVRLLLKVAEYAAGAGQAVKATRSIVDEVDNLGKKSPSRFNDIAVAAGGAGLALLGVAGYAVKAAATFEKQMSEVSAVSGAAGKDFAALRAAALQTGKDTQFSATQAAQAEAELAKAGMSTADILGGGLKGAVALAAAGQIDLADAATITTQALNMFQLGSGQASHVADLLAGAANTSAADMHGLGLGLQQVGLVAHQAGFTLEETTGVLAAFADRGLQGSDGATSLKTAIQRLTAPTAEARSLMDSLGLSVYDSNGHVRDAAGLAGQLQKSLAPLSNEQRNMAMNTIFGSDAIRAANVLYGLGAEGVQRYTAAVDQSGAAAETARKKTDNLAGDIERLKGSIETAAIEAGSGANGGLRILVQALDHLVGGFSALPGPVQTALTVIAGVGGTGLLASAGLLKVRQTARDAMEALREMGPAGEKAATGLGRIGSVVGKGSAITAGVFALYEGFTLLGKWIDTWNAPVVRDVDKMTAALKEFSATGRATGEMAKTFGPEMGRLAKDIDAVAKSNEYLAKSNVQARSIVSAGGKGGGTYAEVQADITRKSVLQQREDLKALDQAFANLASSGGINQAKISLEQLSAITGKPVSELLDLMPKYREAIGAAAAANSGAAKGFGDAATNAQTLAGSLEQAMRAGQSLKDVFDQLNGAQINLTQAQINAEDAEAKFAQALKDSAAAGNDAAHILDIHNEKGRAAAQTSIDLANTARDVAQATYDQTGSVEAASAAFNVYRQKLIDDIATAGHTRVATDETRAAAGRLADQIMQMPAFKKIDIQVPGMDAATERVIGLQRAVGALHDRVVTVTTIHNDVTGQDRISVNPGRRIERWGGLYQHAAAGVLRDASLYSAAASGARYAFAEPATGGEFFGPKYGDLARTRAMATYAVRNWWGGDVTWGGKASRGGGGGGTVVVNNNFEFSIATKFSASDHRVVSEISEALIGYMKRGGGLGHYIRAIANNQGF
jgi:TP901 family phage tail tape measure protein